MDHASSTQEEELELDLESGLNTSDKEEDEYGGLVSDNGRNNKILTRATGGRLSVDKLSDTSELLIDNSSDQSQDNRKRTASRKPPRPPKGPTLNLTDMKILREMTELAMRKRARIERIQALNKSRGLKSSSSSSSMSLIITSFAMLITLIFALLIFFQGI